jgi:electron transport complex protein RnfC
MRTLERDKAASDAARERFEFRNRREEREKAEKAARLAAKTAAARQAIAGSDKAAAAPSPAAAESAPALPQLDEAKRALIAAAIARAQAQKDGVQPKNIDNLAPEKQAEIREIEARRAQVREMAKTPPEEPV